VVINGFLFKGGGSIQELFTFTSLGTLSGAVVATLLLVQFLKELRPLKQIYQKKLDCFTSRFS
jgi:hypothetical protein